MAGGVVQLYADVCVWYILAVVSIGVYSRVSERSVAYHCVRLSCIQSRVIDLNLNLYYNKSKPT